MWKLNHVDGLKQGIYWWYNGSTPHHTVLQAPHHTVLQAPPHKYNIYTIRNDYSWAILNPLPLVVQVIAVSMFILSISNDHNILISIHYFLPSIIYHSLRCMGIAAAFVSTAVAVVGSGEVFSMTAACLSAALLSHRFTLAVDQVTQLWWSLISLGNSRHRDIIPNLPAEVSDIHRFFRRWCLVGRFPQHGL